MANTEEHELAQYQSKQRPDSLDTDGELQDTENKHASHYLEVKAHWGLPRLTETVICYILAVLGWLSLIAAAAVAPYERVQSPAFIATITVGCVLYWAAWFQTAFAMYQRASWRREETLVERVQFLFFAIRLQRLMIPTAAICLVTFIQAYARRHELHEIAYWLIFLLLFIVNTVFSVMNAYNNITWEADRMWYDEGLDGIPKVAVAILGI